MDLSLEIDQNCSLTSCLRNFRWGPGARGGAITASRWGREGQQGLALGRASKA